MDKNNKPIFCFFGNYKPEYSRNRVLIRGLEENGVTVMQCHDESKGIKLYYNLMKKHIRIKIITIFFLFTYSANFSNPLYFYHFF